MRSLRLPVTLAVLFCFAFVLGLPSAAFAALSGISISPPNPTTADIVLVTVDGSFPDACWGWSLSGPPDTWLFGPQSVSVYYCLSDSWTDGSTCEPVVTPYHRVLINGPLAAGTWTFSASECHLSYRDPTAQSASVQVEVQPASSVQPTAWGGIKRLYMIAR